MLGGWKRARVHPRLPARVGGEADVGCARRAVILASFLLHTTIVYGAAGECVRVGQSLCVTALSLVADAVVSPTRPKTAPTQRLQHETDILELL